MIGSKLWVVNIRRFGTPLKGLGVTGRTVFKGCLNSIWKAIYLIKFEALPPRDGSQVQRCNLAPIFYSKFLCKIVVGVHLGVHLGVHFCKTWVYILTKKRAPPREETCTLDRVFAVKCMVKGIETYIFYLRRGKVLKRLSSVQ